MQPKEIVQFIEEKSFPILEENALEMVDCEFIKEAGSWYLRLYIERKELEEDENGRLIGVSIDECEKVSRALDAFLSDDIYKEPYILEVSSPGIDRILKKEKEFIRYAGRIVDLKLFKPVDGQKEFQGQLVGLEGDEIVINVADEQMRFNKKEVSVCRLAIIFD